MDCLEIFPGVLSSNCRLKRKVLRYEFQLFYVRYVSSKVGCLSSVPFVFCRQRHVGMCACAPNFPQTKSPARACIIFLFIVIERAEWWDRIDRIWDCRDIEFIECMLLIVIKCKIADGIGNLFCCFHPMIIYIDNSYCENIMERYSHHARLLLIIEIEI